MELARGFSGETGEAYKSEVREAVALKAWKVEFKKHVLNSFTIPTGL